MTRLLPDGTDARGRKRWSLVLLPVEAAIVKSLPDQLASLLADPDSNRRVIDRLFPPGYTDEQEQRDNRELLGASLLGERKQMLEEARELLDGGFSAPDGGLTLPLLPEQMDLLLRFLNDVRLVLATDLGIEKDISAEEPEPDDPDAPRHALLEYLGGVEAILVDALRETF